MQFITRLLICRKVPIECRPLKLWGTNYIKDNNEWPANKEWDELSYYSRMKNSVQFIRMYIIELNRVNYRIALNDFNQGKQPSGVPRKPKFKITKNNIDNFIIFKQDYTEISNLETI